MISGKDFDELFDKLCQAWTVGNKDKKASIYYERLSYVDYDVFASVIYNILDTNTRFPTIAEIKNLYNNMKPKTALEKHECRSCDGFGRVMLGLDMFKSRCEHGFKVSGKYKKVPYDEALELKNQQKEYDEVYGLGAWQDRVNRLNSPMSLENKGLDSNWEIQIMLNPGQFIKGFSVVSDLMKSSNPELYQKVRTKIISELGKDKAISLWKEHASTRAF